MFDRPSLTTMNNMKTMKTTKTMNTMQGKLRQAVPKLVKDNFFKTKLKLLTNPSQKYSLRRGLGSDFTKKCGSYYNQPILSKEFRLLTLWSIKMNKFKTYFRNNTIQSSQPIQLFFAPRTKILLLIRKKKTRLLSYILVFLSVIRQITLVDNFIGTLNIFA